jgi:hypothetical protein
VNDHEVGYAMKKYPVDYAGLVPRTWRVKPATASHIDEIADTMGVAPSRLVDYLLRLALTEVEAGKWKIRRRPVQYAIDEDDLD